MRLVLLIVTLLVLPLSAYGQEATSEASMQVFTFEIDGIERTYVLHVPDDLEGDVPLVIALHGRFGDGQNMADVTAFNPIADREGFIVVYPDGVNGEWNYVRDVPGYPEAQDDVAFLIALTEHLAAEYPIDVSRVYVTGYSNGGFMAQRAACERPEHFAAFASVAAAGFGGMNEVCLSPDEGNAPMLLINGSDDSNIPWEGTGVTRNGRTIYVTYPIPETLGLWAEFNECTAEAETRELPQLGFSPGTQVRVLTVDCPPNAPVILYAVVGGGHNWPGFDQPDLPPEFGRVNRDIDASEVIWEFFSQHPQVEDGAE